MKKTTYILSALVLILSLCAVIVWRQNYGEHKDVAAETRYGINEGMQLVELTMAHGERQYVVEDGRGNELFRIPLRGCLLDTHFRNGRLRFREMSTGREGYIDTQGMVVFTAVSAAAEQSAIAVPEDKSAGIDNAAADAQVQQIKALAPHKEVRLPATDIRKIAQSSPFYAEAVRIVSGKLAETDAARRRLILNYCEHLRTAYNSKDIDFLQQVFSDEALIIVGNVVKPSKESGKLSADSRVSYALHTKRDYLSRLSKVFAVNKKVDVKFSDFRIMRHPTKDGIYGVSLRQRYHSDRYADDGYLFLLWDFSNASMPLIHVRTWQPSATVADSDGVVDISDFNLE